MTATARASSRSLPILLCLLLAALATAAAAHAKVPASERVVPIWAGIEHGKPVRDGVVVVRSRGGKLLAPRVHTAKSGVASTIAPRRLPRSFVVEVRRQAGEAGLVPVLRATVRNWSKPRVVHVNPYSTVLSVYSKLHPKMDAATATARVQRHLGLAVGRPDETTFWGGHAFSATRYAKAARKQGGLLRFSKRIAGEVDGARKPHRFPSRKGKGEKKVARISVSRIEESSKRLRTEEELMDAAKTAVGVATGSPAAIVQFGQLLDSLLGGGDTAVLKEISTQLATIQQGISNIEEESNSIGSEVSIAAYSSAVNSYRPTQEQINLAWSQYVHAAAYMATSAESKAEAALLADRLEALGETIPSATAVPADEGAPGLMAWAQNAGAKELLGGVMTAFNQETSRAAGFVWWSYWWKDLILHTEKWNNAQTKGEISAWAATEQKQASLKGLEEARQDEYGTTLPETLVYAINPGKLYSVGTVWNVAPDLAPPASGQPAWAQMSMQEAEALPNNTTGLRTAITMSVPTYPENPNTSMNGVLGPQPNNGSWPSFAGTGGGYGEPPAGTQIFALSPSPGGECYGQWEWYTNGQGSSNLTGAPIIRLCPALNVGSGKVLPSVPAQINLKGHFYAWSEPQGKEPGLRDKPIEFETLNQYERWQNAGGEYKGLNWGTGVFSGDSPLSAALDISNSNPAYYALWVRAIGPGDNFLVGPVTNSG
jgi:hypothetical protein